MTAVPKKIRIGDTVYLYRVAGTSDIYVGHRPATAEDGPSKNPLAGWGKVEAPNGTCVYTPPKV